MPWNSTKYAGSLDTQGMYSIMNSPMYMHVYVQRYWYVVILYNIIKTGPSSSLFIQERKQSNQPPYTWVHIRQYASTVIEQETIKRHLILIRSLVSFRKIRLALLNKHLAKQNDLASCVSVRLVQWINNTTKLLCYMNDLSLIIWWLISYYQIKKCQDRELECGIDD